MIILFQELKNRIIIVAGALLLAVLGRQKFYRLTQAKSKWFSKLPAYFCLGHIQRLVHDYEVQIEGGNKERISDAALALYSDDSLAGYGDLDFTKADGKPLLGQQRGLIIPLVCAEIDEFISIKKATPRVLEIGTANGDVLAYLANEYPDVKFSGIDLSVKNAEFKHHAPNLKFVKGYSLDMFTEKPDLMKADIVFGTSTFCAMVPKEFRRHVELLAANGTSSLIVSDPIAAGMKHSNDDRDISLHMSRYMWWHNYAGYLRRVGFSISHWELRKFSYSWNPNAIVILVAGRMPS